MDIRVLKSPDLRAAADLLSRGMRDNPNHIAAWGRDADQRRRALARFFVPVLQGLLARGSVLGAFEGATLTGVCGMAPPGKCRPRGGEKLCIVPSLLVGNSPLVALRVLRWTGAWARRDPGQNHWHLGPVAVDAQLQGRGIGGALLARFSAYMDEQGATAYLETDKQVNVTFYEQYGFRVTATSEVLGVPNWYMIRVAERRAEAIDRIGITEGACV